MADTPEVPVDLSGEGEVKAGKPSSFVSPPVVEEAAPEAAEEPAVVALPPASVSIVLHTVCAGPNSVSSDSYDYFPKPVGWNRDRLIHVDRAVSLETGLPVGTYEHESEDADGRWVYRKV